MCVWVCLENSISSMDEYNLLTKSYIQNEIFNIDKIPPPIHHPFYRIYIFNCCFGILRWMSTDFAVDEMWFSFCKRHAFPPHTLFNNFQRIWGFKSFSPYNWINFFFFSKLYTLNMKKFMGYFWCVQASKKISVTDKCFFFSFFPPVGFDEDLFI